MIIKTIYKEGCYYKIVDRFRVVYQQSGKIEYKDFKTEKSAKSWISRNTKYYFNTIRDHYSHIEIKQYHNTKFY